MSELSLMTLNIANPSPERAQRQLDWLAARDEKVLALTETKDSAGCRLLADAFTATGYHVTYPIPENGDYGVVIASKVKAITDPIVDEIRKGGHAELNNNPTLRWGLMGLALRVSIQEGNTGRALEIYEAAKKFAAAKEGDKGGNSKVILLQIAGMVKDLQEYDFTSSEARERFEQLDLVFGNSTKTTVTPCSGCGSGAETRAPMCTAMPAMSSPRTSRRCRSFSFVRSFGPSSPFRMIWPPTSRSLRG